MVKQIIKEAIEKNPIGLKEAVEAELMERLALALEAKKKSYKEEYDHDEEELEESLKVGDTVKIKSNASKTSLLGHKNVLGKTGKIVKDYGDGDFKVNFGGNNDRSVSGSDLVKESIDLDESKMDDKDVLSAAKALAKNGKDAKTRSFGQGLVDYHKENGSFTPAQVGGLQNIMKNASFQLAKESVELDEAVVGAGLANFDGGSNIIISKDDAAAINRMFASKSREEQEAIRKKMKSSKSYYSSVLSKAKKDNQKW